MKIVLLVVALLLILIGSWFENTYGVKYASFKLMVVHRLIYMILGSVLIKLIW